MSELSLELDASIQVEGDVARDAEAATGIASSRKHPCGEREGFVREKDVGKILLSLLLRQLDPR